MRPGLVILLLAPLLGVTGFALVRWQQHMADHAQAHEYARLGAEEHHAELDWMSGELGVSEEQLVRISALHGAYQPVREALTHRLENSNQKLDELTAMAGSVSPEIESALQDHAAVSLDCQRAMLKHFYETAGCLSPPQSRKYLQRMLPVVYPHNAAGSEAHSH